MTASNRTTVDVDDEHTRLLTFRSAAAAATERIDELTVLLDGMVAVVALPAGGVDEPDVGSTLPDAIAAASTVQMMNQATFRAALGTLASPVQRSLLAFVG